MRLSRNICVKLLNFPKFQLGLKYYFHFLRLRILTYEKNH